MNNSKIKYAGISLLIILIAIVLLTKKDYSPLSGECEKKVCEVLEKDGIKPENIARETPRENSKFLAKTKFVEKEFQVPAEQDLEEIKKDITESDFLKKFPISKIEFQKNNTEHRLSMEFSYKKLMLYRMILKKKLPKAKLAIILDDWGYSMAVLDEFIALKTAITCSILPHLTYSSNIAEKLKEQGYEYMLHLPLEPNDSSAALEKTTILTSMTEEQIIDTVRAAIKSLPGIKGVNNHMGSKVTGDEPTLKIVLRELKNHSLFFLDSYVSTESVGEKVAAGINIPFLKRDIFLDDKNDKELILKELEKAKNIAEKHGSAIAIGHAKKSTLEVLAEVIPRFKQNGIEFVYVSDLLKKTTNKKSETID
ncbi:MAG: divergent polysaccharide deacetylase family protein [Candidatus Omnitrophota bacterium]